MLNELVSELNTRGVDFVKVVDISRLPANLGMGYDKAVVLGVLLSPEYIRLLSVENKFDEKEFDDKEVLADNLADWLAEYISRNGYKAYSQSEKSLYAAGFYNKTTQTTRFPNKTIALMAGLGWIGKNNLLVTSEYGSSFCFCTVLTNAPLPTENKPTEFYGCGNCTICVDACEEKALTGNVWEPGIEREKMLDFKRCTLCLKCLAKCPWAQKYMKKNIPF
jgi:epoxyqueuosine reductase QueG